MSENTVILQTKTLGAVFGLNQTPEMEEIKQNLYLPLHIPDYQRIYCWEEKNVYQLLDDIAVISKPYHLGSIILHKTKSNEIDVLAIVDGQQRLVTLALLINELDQETGNKIKLLDEKFESKEAQNYVAYNKFLIKNYVKTKTFDVTNLIVNIQFSILIIDDANLDLAYTFFSNQNSRGKSLSDYDLLKAHHLRYVLIEEQAKHLAQRWDNILLESNSDENEKNIKRLFNIYLFRLRKWMRKNDWYDKEKFKVKTEFEAALIIPEIPPFGEKFNFNESIQGGTHFFAYAESFIEKYKVYSDNNIAKLLNKLEWESHWWYKDVMEGLLFAYYLKFGTMYLAEALICIEKQISVHRFGVSRSSFDAVLKHATSSEIVMMIDQATSPTFFLAESLKKINRFAPLTDENKKSIRGRYFNKTREIYNEIGKNLIIENFKQLIK